MRHNVPVCGCGLQPVHGTRQHVVVDLWNTAIAAGLVDDKG
jgi:hypothetical protein